MEGQPMTASLVRQCSHRILGIDTRVITCLEDGYAARCLLCDTLGPVTNNWEDALIVLSDKRTTSVEE